MKTVNPMISLNRRQLLKIAAGSSGGLLVGFALPGCSQIPVGQQEDSLRPNAWLEITTEGKVILTLDRVEMGQGTMTGMATLLGEELDVEPAQIAVVFAPVGKDYIQPDYGLQITGGSTSISSNWVRIREAGAAGRALLVAAAADVWQVSPDQITTVNGVCSLRSSGQQIAYKNLVAMAVSHSVPDPLVLKPREQYRYIGKHNKRLDATVKTFGLAKYGIDTQLDNLLYAVLTRAPMVGGRLVQFDATQAEQAPGVVRVFETPLGIAVVARSYWQARKAQVLVKAEWQPGDIGTPSSAEVFALYANKLDEDSGTTVRDDGDANDALEAAGRVIEAEYRLPFLAHATLEPQNCTAWVRKDRCDVWAPTQGPDIARFVARRACGLSASDIHIHTTYIGGGFGRRLSQDYVSEAVTIAKHFEQPVKLIWSREEDTQHDFYRPASLHRLRAGINEQGKPSSWHHRIAAPRVLDYYVKDAAGALAPGWTPNALVKVAASLAPLTTPDISAYEGADDIPYAFDDVLVEHVKADAGIPISYWRAVGHSFNGFVIESFIDELAHEAGEDAMAYRMNLLKAVPRHQNVLQLASERAGWGKPLPAGHFQGVAVHKSFGTVVAEVAEVSVEEGRIRVHKVTCAVDCGQVVNPEIVTAQMESGIIFGLTAALHGEINFKKGQVQQSNFDDYPILRMDETPAIDVILVDSNESPTGVGEPGLPPIAPAVANALFKATGRRLRSLPLRLA
jgi:isoquinoline 1-oxidoreductase beta subunit